MMKFRTVVLIVLCLAASIVLYSPCSWADSDESSEASKHSPDKAITEHGPEGFRLSELAIKRLKVETIPSGIPLTLPTEAVVRAEERTGVYRLRRGWYKFVPAEVRKRQGEKVTIALDGVEPGDTIVVSGAALLNVADLSLMGGMDDHD